MERSDKTTCEKDRLGWLALALVVALQCALFVVAGTQREDFHIDEVYSYVIANSTKADRISHADWLLDTWVSGEDFDELVSVQPGEELDFAAAYNNTALDSHPPLYYWALHAACSLVPGVFTAWAGLAINILFFAVGQVFLYLICRELMQCQALRLVPVTLFGFSAYALGAVEFIRMYALLTALTMAFTYFTLLVARRGVGVRTVLPAFITLYLGALTQYYFLVYAFWLILMLAIRFLAQKRVKDALAYGFSMVAGVALFLASFPYAIAQATGSETNNVGNEVARSMFDFALWGKKTVGLARDLVLGLSISPLVAKAAMAFATICLVAAVVWTLAHLRGAKTPHHLAGGSADGSAGTAKGSGLVVAWLAAAFALTFLSVSKIGGEYVYLRYVYFVLPLAFVVWTFIVGSTLASSGARVALLALSLAFGAVNAAFVVVRSDPSYTYSNTAATNAEVTAHNDYPLVMLLSGEGTVTLTGNFTTLREFGQVWAGDLQSEADQGAIAEALNETGGCIVYIPQATSWTTGYDASSVLEGLAQSIEGLQWTMVSDQDFGDYYLLTSGSQA